MQAKQRLKSITALMLTLSLAGCATTTSKDHRDPLEGWNRSVQSFNDKFDQYAMKPVAQGYNWIMPEFADQGVSNFFSNLNDISVTVNDLLQFKLSQSGLDASRFLVNTVAGVGGLVDVASMVNLSKHYEDFDQTMGVWGVPAGPYLVLPLLGPSSPRGVGGLVGDAAMNPATYVGFGAFPGMSNGVEAAISSGMYVLNAIDKRSDNLATEKVISEAATEDRYEFIKNAYFQRRDYLVNDGNVPDTDTDIDSGKPEGGSLAPLDPHPKY